MADVDTAKKQEHTEKLLCPECGLPFKVPADSSLDDVHKHSAKEKPAKDESPPARSTKDSPGQDNTPQARETRTGKKAV